MSLMITTDFIGLLEKLSINKCTMYSILLFEFSHMRVWCMIMWTEKWSDLTQVLPAYKFSFQHK